jgi:dihydropteroate synthase
MTKKNVVPMIMGVLNVTPDSFYDGGRYCHLDQALKQALKMVSEGAHFIDIGGESTRPQAKPISVQEECDRVIPVIEAIKKETDVILSIDTRHAEVMQAALGAGVGFINDVCALQEPGTLAVAAASQAKLCLMHMQGTPQTMQKAPFYHHVVEEIVGFFANRIEVCEKAGILRENVWIDPGFGFGKNLVHNLTLLANLSQFQRLGCALLIGFSRKSMFGEILNKPTDQRLFASLAATTIAALQGVSIIRTHDVAETKDVLAVVQAVQPYLQGSEKADVCFA